MNSKLEVLDQSISTTTKEGVECICITGIAKYKNSDSTGAAMQQMSVLIKPCSSLLIKRG